MAPFWQVKPLAAMSLDEWEQLCDGCGRCCLKKMELPDGTVRYTRVACTLLDIEHCRCRAYADRGRKVLTCMVLSSEFVANHAYLLPSTCAYRLLQEGRRLPEWHHLVCGDPDRVHQLGFSVMGRVISEDYVHPDDLEDLAIEEDEV